MVDDWIALDAADVDTAASVAEEGLMRIRAVANVAADAPASDLVMNATMGVVDLMAIHSLAQGVELESVAEGLMRGLGHLTGPLSGEEKAAFVAEALRAFEIGMAEMAEVMADDAIGETAGEA